LFLPVHQSTTYQQTGSFEDPHPRDGPQMDVHEVIKESDFYGHDHQNQWQWELISHSIICQTNGAVPIHPANILSSAWQPGALTDIVFGQVLQIIQLSSKNQDIDSELAAF
jgi:hypothetical protein